MKYGLTQGLMVTATLVLGTATKALAAGARQDSSSAFVYGFLSLCALIALAQLLPALGRMVQRASSSVTEPEHEPEPVVVRSQAQTSRNS